MIEARGVVLRTADRRAWVRVDDQPTGCGRCHEPGGCGGAKIAHAFGKPDEVFHVDNPQHFAAGDRVRLQIDDGAALGAAAISYGLPTLAALVGAGVGTWWSGNAGAVIGLAAALALSVAAVRRIGGRRFWRQKLSVRLAADAACAQAGPVTAHHD
ncbi:SoxR reducing system RseC family protein [Denitromonas iodatirespirans]|uniref:SoxR reducing system RseC family protein n=1 Tax=Denitromonas iodatirespirans TaxID=2795389 RepID=A0A944D9U6_DENI1|nr:SoxR reducing system RseC family protein [Denitromonas iodatirespirans]MBT0961392.1 SoxR reducing system RseC family protein [Denitromonas iodatirespirans]